MKRSELIFNITSIPIDVIALASAGVIAFYLRIRFTDLVGPITYNLNIGEFLLVSMKVIPVLILTFTLLGLYNLKGTRRFIHDFNKIIIGISLATLAVMVVFFFKQSLFPSRFIILATWVLGISFVLIGRILLRKIQTISFKQGYGLHKLVLINGSGTESEAIQESLRNPAHGYKIIKEFHNSESVVSELEDLAKTEWIDEIMQANPKATDQDNLSLVRFARKRGIQFSYVPNLFDVQRNAIELVTLRGIPVISLKNSPLDGWGKVTKRIFDIVSSIICITITSPLLLFIAVVIRLDSKGPAIYKNQRGSQNKTFWFYKFRTMYTHLSVGQGYGGQEAEILWQQLREKNDRGGLKGPVSKFKDDPRVTKVGRWLRKTKLDELPQFFNVLKGDISMVGPRPHILPELDNYKHQYPRILSIKPGIFGPAQLAIITWPVFPFEEEMRVNMYYIENWSLWFDVKILVNSFFLLIFGKNSKDNY